MSMKPPVQTTESTGSSNMPPPAAPAPAASATLLSSSSLPLFHPVPPLAAAALAAASNQVSQSGMTILDFIPTIKLKEARWNWETIAAPAAKDEPRRSRFREALLRWCALTRRRNTPLRRIGMSRKSGTMKMKKTVPSLEADRPQLSTFRRKL
ncbi:hypothetical protein BDZ97DRAFT_1916800 [Flammula alnicola]|nr:hypothetical protein BDZ97DRAFT_1916800 [Flammula alnicola]